jgi:hypothetical protein
MDRPTPRPRALIGRLLLSSAAVMLVLAAAFYVGWLEIDPSARPLVAGVLVVAAIADAVIGLRFLGESK